jgi:hypothetical protein
MAQLGAIVELQPIGNQSVHLTRVPTVTAGLSRLAAGRLPMAGVPDRVAGGFMLDNGNYRAYKTASKSHPGDRLPCPISCPR